MIWHVEASGVWLIDGGMHAVAQCFARMIEERGGQMRYGAPVAEILTRDGKTTGVRLKSGEEIPADVVLFNGDAAALADGLLGAAASKAVPQIRPRQRSLSALTLALNAETEGFPLAHHTVFFCDDYRAEFRDIRRDRLPENPSVYLCAQDRGGSGEDPIRGPERILAVINARASGDQRPHTSEEIERCQESAFRLMERAGLRLTPVPGGLVPTSPAGFAELFPATGGALYGRSPHGPMAAFARPGSRSRLSGLYLAGGSAHPGAGVPMATLSGRLAASAILEDRTGTAPASTPMSRRGAISGGISTASPRMASTR